MTLSNSAPLANRKSAFAADGIKQAVDKIHEQIRDLYLNDEIPWVIGYSGGKDSTATLQLIWSAVAELPADKRSKPIYVISTDTLVENPVVALWVNRSLKAIQAAADEQGLPIKPNRLVPSLQDRYWVNLIGRGYPAPRPKFRWCTSRLKINPSNNFIQNLAHENGEAILVLGTRKLESTVRKAVKEKFEADSTRELLEAHGQLDRSWVYTPIAEWSNDDVWLYLNQYKNPWGYSNKNLLGMYQGATEDGECPLVVDTSTPSCGDSRFGCYVCTLVEKDKSMHAMIQNDAEKEWMLPMMEFRNKWLDVKEDRKHRDYRRMNGSLTLHNGRLVHGPYKAKYRHDMLGALLKTQVDANEMAPADIDELEIISLNELQEIRRIWVTEKHEIDDELPAIYEKATGQSYPGEELAVNNNFKKEDLSLLKSICNDYGDPDSVLYQTGCAALSIEQEHRTKARRTGLYKKLESTIDKAAFSSEEEAEQFALERAANIEVARQGSDDEDSDIVREAPDIAKPELTSIIASERVEQP